MLMMVSEGIPGGVRYGGYFADLTAVLTLDSTRFSEEADG